MWGGWSAPPSMPWAGTAPPAAGAPPPPPPPADLFGADDGIDWDDAAFAQIDAAVAVMGRVWRMGQRAERVVTYRLLSTATLEEVIFLRQLKKVDKQLAVFDEEGSGITAAELDDAELEELFAVGSRTWSLAFRGREEHNLDAPPHTLLGGALEDGYVE